MNHKLNIFSSLFIKTKIVSHIVFVFFTQNRSSRETFFIQDYKRENMVRLVFFLFFTEMRPLVMICLSCNQRPCLKRFGNGWPRLLPNRRQPLGGEVQTRGRHSGLWPTLLEPVSLLKRYTDLCRVPNLWPYHQIFTKR